MNATKKLTTLAEIVEDIIENMPEASKATVVETSENELWEFHHGWGIGIRNGYNLWRNPTLLKELGADDPDDASMLIIKAVWQRLKESGETYHKSKIDTDTLHWHENERCLEIKAGARSLIIQGIDYKYAEALADGLRLKLSSSSMYYSPESEPRETLMHSVILNVWVYPRHPDNQ